MNEPEKWENQMWVIPHEVRLERNGEHWYITALYGSIKIPIMAGLGERLSGYVANEQRYQSRKFRRSLAFRWERFWYLRRKRREANKSQ